MFLAVDSRPNVPVMTRGLAQVLLVVDGVGFKASVVVPSGGERDAASGASQGTTDIGAPFRCFREGDQRRVTNPGPQALVAKTTADKVLIKCYREQVKQVEGRLELINCRQAVSN